MQTITVVKVTRKAPDLEYIEDRAVSDFRAFKEVGSLHIKRVRTPLAINAMLDVLESLKNDLHKKTLMLS